jgi:hypothetical protein
LQDDYNYNNYGYNSDGYAGYNNDKNEYYVKYHGIKIVGNRFNYGGSNVLDPVDTSLLSFLYSLYIKMNLFLS